MIKIKRIKICILIILILLLFEYKSIAGYIQKINLKVNAQIAMPILEVNHDEQIIGNYFDISNIPEYTFEIKNYNQTKVSEINFYVNIQIISQNKLEYELIDCSNNEIILNNVQNQNTINIEKNKPYVNKFKIVLKSDCITAEEKLKIIINAKYFKYELDAFQIKIDRRNLEYSIFTSETNKKYTNKDVFVQIKCNKEIKNVPGFELSEDKTCLTKVFNQNVEETISIVDYYNNKKEITISVKNIDKIVPEIVGVEDGKSYNKGKELIYKDNIGIKSIKIENTTKHQLYSTTFDKGNKIVDNKVLIVNNNSINPNYLNQSGNYTIVVTDFAENQSVRHINIK